MKRIGLIGCFLVLTLSVFGQARTTTQNGSWSNPATWGGNPPPDFNVGVITVNHIVTIEAVDYPIATPLQVNQFVISSSGNVTVQSGAAMQLTAATGTEMTINATGLLTFQTGSEFIITAASVHSGTSVTNTVFQSGAVLRTATATLPTASGYADIDVYLQDATGALTLGTSWNQLTATTDLIVSCPNLGNNALTFAGNITNLASLLIEDTDALLGGRVVLGASGTITLNVGSGGVTTQGDSRLFVSNGTGNVTLDVSGGFTFSPNETAQYSQLASTGTGVVNVNAGVNMSSGELRMASTGTGTLTLNGGDMFMSGGTYRVASGSGGDGFLIFNNNSGLQVSGGTFIESGTGTAQGTFRFLGGSGDQDFNWPVSSVGVGTFNLEINKTSGSVVLNDDLTISGLTIDEGNLVLNGNLMTVAGTISISNGFIDATTPSALTISGTGTLPATVPFVVGSELTSLTLNRTGSTLVTSNISMSDEATITRTLGNFGATIPALGVIDVIYNNTSTITTGPELPTGTTGLRNLTKQSSGALNLGANVTINGDLTLVSGSGTFAASTFTVDLAGDFYADANFTMNFASTFTFLTRISPANTHTLSGAGTTVSMGNLVVNGSLTVSRSITTTAAITINNASSIQATSGTWTFGGTSPIANNGTLAFNAVSITTGNSMTAPLNGIFSIAGNFTTPGTFNVNGSTVEFNGTTVLSAVETYNNIIVQAGASLSGAVGMVVLGNVVNDGSFTLTAGTVTWNSDGTFSGTSAASVVNLTISSTRTLNLTLEAPLTINNNLTLTGSLVHSTTDDLTIGGSMSGNGEFSSTGRVIFTGGSAALTGTGTKTFTSMRVTGTLIMGSTASYSFINTGSLDVDGMLNTTNGTSTATISGSTTILNTGVSTTFNNLTIAGTLTASGAITLNRNFTNNGTFNHGTGEVIFSTATAAKTIGGTSLTTFYNLTVSDNGAAIDVVNNGLSGLNLAGVLSIAGSATFDADGTADDRSFILLSSNDDPADDASVGPLLSGASISGTFTVQRYISAESPSRLYRYISSPVIGATVSQWQDDVFVTGTFTGAHNGSTPGCTGCTSNASSFRYNEATQAYVSYPTPITGSNTDPVESGRGYSVYFRHNVFGNVILDYTGTHPATGANISLPVAPSAGDFSLVGNPYPAPLLWSTTGWNKSSGMSDFISITDNASGGVFRVFDIADGDGVITTGQAFWIETLNTGTTPVLEVNESAKTSTQASGGIFYRTDKIESDKLIVRLKKGDGASSITIGLEDEAALRIETGTALEKDSRDASNWDNSMEIESGSENVTVQVHDIAFRSTDNAELAINTVPSIACSGQTFNLVTENLVNPAYSALGIAAETRVTYTLSVEALGALGGLTWVLHDKHSNQDINLSLQSTYQFVVDNSVPSSKATNRFTLATVSTPINIQAEVTTTTPQICTGMNAVVKVDDSQPGVLYVLELNGELTTITGKGNGSKISMFISEELLATGITSVQVRANSGCTQEYLTNIIQIEKRELGIPTVTDVTNCSPGIVNLQAAGVPEGGTYAWYETASSVTVLGTEAVYSTPELFDTTVYFVALVNAFGCEGDRVAVKANIGDNGSGLQVHQSFPICKGESAQLSASGGFSFRWYSSATDHNVLDDSNQFITPSLTTDTSFFVSVVDENDCESGRIEYIVDVEEFEPLIEVVQVNPVCLSGTTQLDVVAEEGVTYEWYSTETAEMLLMEGNTFATEQLESTRTYYIRAANSRGCFSSLQPIEVKVFTEDASADLQTNSEVICMGDNATVTVVSNSQDFLWFESEESLIPLQGGNSFVTASLNAAKDYYVAGVSAEGCIGTRKRVTVDVIVYEQPTIELVSETEIKSNYESSNQWYLNSNILPGKTDQELIMTQSGRYGLSVITQGCEAYTDGIFSVTGMEELLENQVNFYPNPASSYFTLENNATVRIEIQVIDSKGILMTNFGLNSGEKIDVATKEFTRGINLIRISRGDRIFVKKIILN